ncbi:MAG: uroporphyrinogen decarboxylase family protein [Clostridia bacterium]|nr:uroporphyrinogen decarboxylase family protein [Clostridia bacterium]
MRAWLKATVKALQKPAFPILAFPGAALIHKPVKSIICDSALQAFAIKAIADRVPMLAALGLMDMSLEAERFGCPIRLMGNEVPMVARRIVFSRRDARNLAVPDVMGGRTGVAVGAIGRAASIVRDRPLLACCIGPFSLAGRLMGVSELMLACYDQPDMVQMIVEKATEFLIEYIRAFRRAGANGILLAEPLTGLLPPVLAEAFSEPWVRSICRSVRGEQFLFFYHNCGGSAVAIIQSILAIGADAYHFGNAVEMERVLQAVPSDTVVMGNLDPVMALLMGSKASVTRDVATMLERCGGYNNYIVSTGCDIPSATPWENIDALFAVVAAYYQRRPAAS